MFNYVTHFWIFFLNEVCVLMYLYPYFTDDAEDVKLKTDLPLNMECEHILRVKEVYISSAILAAKSPFFYKVSQCLELYAI